MMQVFKFTFNLLQSNTYVVFNEHTKKAVVIDPGCSNFKERETLSEFLENRCLDVYYILNTHFHLDHTIGNHFIKSLYPFSKLVAPKFEKELLIVAQKYIPNELELGNYIYIEPDIYVEGGEKIELWNDKLSLDVSLVSGHSPGHVVYYNDQLNCLFTGDTLFFQSIGRTDFKFGSFEDLIQNIKSKLLTYPDETLVFPGHGENTSIGYEKLFNPFLKKTQESGQSIYKI